MGLSGESLLESGVGRSSSRKSFSWETGSDSFAKAKGNLLDLDGGGKLQRLLSTQERFAQEKTYSLSAIIFPFLFPALGGLLFGFNIGATSGAVLSLTSDESSGVAWRSLSKLEEGLVVSGPLYGALLGSILAFNIADALGRRRELLVSAISYSIGILFISLAPSLSFLITGRVVYGVGIGLAMHAAPVYISETSPFQIRGTMVSLQEGVTVVGILFGYCVGSWEIEVIGGWRVMYGCVLPIAVVMGLGIWWLPASPRWILLRAVQSNEVLDESKDEARTALFRLRGKTISETIIETELEETLEIVQLSVGGQEKITLMEIFQGRLNQRAFLIAGGLVIFQQITGQPSVLYYAATIIQSAGFSAAADATKVSVILGLFKLLMTGIAIFFVDKIGRRPLLLAGISGIVLSLLALAASYSFHPYITLLSISALTIFVGSYQVSFGPISYLMVSEVFPLRSRGRAMSLTTLLNFAGNAVVAVSFPSLQALVGPAGTFLLFACIAVVALGFVFICAPETKGLTLEEVEAKLSQ